MQNFVKKISKLLIVLLILYNCCIAMEMKFDNGTVVVEKQVIESLAHHVRKKGVPSLQQIALQSFSLEKRTLKALLMSPHWTQEVKDRVASQYRQKFAAELLAQGTRNPVEIPLGEPAENMPIFYPSVDRKFFFLVYPDFFYIYRLEDDVPVEVKKLDGEMLSISFDSRYVVAKTCSQVVVYGLPELEIIACQDKPFIDTENCYLGLHWYVTFDAFKKKISFIKKWDKSDDRNSFDLDHEIDAKLVPATLYIFRKNHLAYQWGDICSFFSRDLAALFRFLPRHVGMHCLPTQILQTLFGVKGSFAASLNGKSMIWQFVNKFYLFDTETLAVKEYAPSTNWLFPNDSSCYYPLAISPDGVSILYTHVIQHREDRNHEVALLMLSTKTGSVTRLQTTSTVRPLWFNDDGDVCYFLKKTNNRLFYCYYRLDQLPLDLSESMYGRLVNFLHTVPFFRM